MSIKSDLDYLEATKGLIKEAIINKGQDIEDNTPFRDYVDKIDNISTEPSKPLGIQVYKRIELLDNQTDLVNYYVQGAQSGEFANLNSYQIRFVNMDITKELPIEHILQIINTHPALIELHDNSQMFYFNSSYTQIFIQVVTSLGLYDNFVGSFLQTWNLTEQQLLQFNGWYAVQNDALVVSSHPIFEHANICWAIKVTIQEFLTSTWGINNVLDFIDLDITNLNITLIKEDNETDALEYVEELYGEFIKHCTATEYQIVEGYTAFTRNGKVTGKYVPKYYVFSQSNQAGTYTYEYMCYYPVSNTSPSDVYEWKNRQQTLLDAHPGLFEIYADISTLYNRTENQIRNYINSISTSDLAALYLFIVSNGSGYLYRHGESGARITATFDQQGNFSMNITTTGDVAITNNVNVAISGTRDINATQLTILNFTIDSIEYYPSTYDATATSLDIVINKTAYINGQKVTGIISPISSGSIGFGLVHDSIHAASGGDTLSVEVRRVDTGIAAYNQGGINRSFIPYSELAEEIGLLPGKIKKDITIIGVTGTYEGEGIKEYASEADMNNDIDNIAEGEIVKVVTNGTTTFYLKEMETTYQPLDFSQLNIGDTISLKGMKINNTATSNVITGSGDFADFILSNNNATILQIHFGAGARSISGSITINNSSYNYSSVAEGEVSELSAADVETINSSNIWSSDTLLTIENNGETAENNYIENAILQPVQQGVMKKLIKEEDTLSVSEYNEAEGLSEDILGNE